MSVLVAVASEDGVNVDQHFGWARELLIYKVEDDGAYELIEERLVPEINSNSSDGSAGSSSSEQNGCGFSEQSGCANASSEETGSINRILEQSGVGCGNGHSCGHNFHDVNLDKLIDSLKDCKYVLALKIGRVMDKLFRSKGISCFSVNLSIDEALKSIATYEQRMHRRREDAEA